MDVRFVSNADNASMIELPVADAPTDHGVRRGKFKWKAVCQGKGFA